MMHPLCLHTATNAPLAASSEARSTQPQGMLRDYRYSESETARGLTGSPSSPVRQSGDVAASHLLSVEGGCKNPPLFCRREDRVDTVVSEFNFASDDTTVQFLGRQSVSLTSPSNTASSRRRSLGSTTSGSWLSSRNSSGRRLCISDSRQHCARWRAVFRIISPAGAPLRYISAERRRKNCLFLVRSPP